MRVGRAVQEGMLKSLQLVMEKFSDTRGDRDEGYRSSMTAVQGLNFKERQNKEVVKGVTKFNAWMTRVMAYLCASAHRADVRLEPNHKSLMNTSMDVSTEEMFRQWKGDDLVLSNKLERFSEEVQFMLVSLVPIL